MDMEANKDNVVPGDKWEFDESVTACFDDMLSRSIPDYKQMRDLCRQVGSKYVQNGTFIVDLGCSRGEALSPFVSQYGTYNRFIGVEVSKPMIDAARAKFGALTYPESNAVVSILDVDLRNAYPLPMPEANGWSNKQASLTLAVLTLQFTPINYRQKILDNIYKSTAPGGALILVEKVLGASAGIDDILVDLYHDHKKANGYSEEDIERKKMSLEGVLVPVTASWNEELLKNAGFSEVDCFWRNKNFGAWIAVKKD